MGMSTKNISELQEEYLALSLSLIAWWRRRSLMTRILLRCPSSLRTCHILRIRNHLLRYWNCHTICYDIVGCPAILMQNLLLEGVSLQSHHCKMMITLFSQLSQLSISLSPHLCKLLISLCQLSLIHCQL